MELVTPDRLIAGQGTPESAWQAWQGLHAIARCAVADLVPPGRRAVIVAPHPDDEVLAFGGLLAMLASAAQTAQAQRPLVLAVTDGEASHPGSMQWPRARLAPQRISESIEGLRQLGISADCRVRLGIPDGEVASRVDALAERIAETLRPGDVLFSTWELDGHPDHEAAAEAVKIAIAAMGARHACTHLQAPVWMWHWARPGDQQVPWPRMRRVVLTAEVLAQKKRAIAAHETQLEVQDTGTPAVLAHTSLARVLRASEYFILPECM